MWLKRIHIDVLSCFIVLSNGRRRIFKGGDTKPGERYRARKKWVHPYRGYKIPNLSPQFGVLCYRESNLIAVAYKYWHNSWELNRHSTRSTGPCPPVNLQLLGSSRTNYYTSSCPYPQTSSPCLWQLLILVFLVRRIHRSRQCHSHRWRLVSAGLRHLTPTIYHYNTHNLQVFSSSFLNMAFKIIYRFTVCTCVSPCPCPRKVIDNIAEYKYK